MSGNRVSTGGETSKAFCQKLSLLPAAREGLPPSNGLLAHALHIKVCLCYLYCPDVFIILHAFCSFQREQHQYPGGLSVLPEPVGIVYPTK